MNDEIKEIANKLDRMRQESIRDKHVNRSYIFWAFTLAALGLTIAYPHPANIGVTIAFFIMGWIMLLRASRVETK